MATDKPQVPEGFAKADPSGSDDDGDVPTINGDEPMPPGTELHGLVLDVEDGETGNGDWYRLRIKDHVRGMLEYFAKGDAKIAARRENIEIGEPIWIAKDTETESFTNDAGDEVEYHPTHVAFPDGDA